MMDFAENAEVRLIKRNEWKSAWKQVNALSVLAEAHFAVYAKKQRKMDGKMKVVARNAKVTEEKQRDSRQELKKACRLLALEGQFFAILVKTKKKILSKVIAMNAKTFEKGRLESEKFSPRNLFKMKGKGSMKDTKTTMSLDLKSSLEVLQTFTLLLETLSSNHAKFAEN